MDEKSVLLVDDEEEFVSVLAERLETRGLKVDTANSGEAALEKAGQRSFDAILLDLAMPGMGGLETLKRLLEINPDLQVILLTGRGTMAQAIEAMKLGALDFLEKPVDIEALEERIAAAANRKDELTDKRIEKQMSDILRKKGW